MADKDITRDEAAEEEEVILVDGEGEAGEAAAEAKKTKSRQYRYIFRNEKGWYEKERDNVRITKYYPTQQKAIEAARIHIKNSGLPGSIVIQSKTGKIRAHNKVAAKKK